MLALSCAGEVHWQKQLSNTSESLVGVDMTAIVIVKAPATAGPLRWLEDCRYEPSPRAI